MASIQRSSYVIFSWLSLALLCVYGQQVDTQGTADLRLDIDRRHSIGSPTSLQSAAPSNQACQLRWQPHCSIALGTLPAYARSGSPAAYPFDNVCLTAYSSDADAPVPQIIFARQDPLDAAHTARTRQFTANPAQLDHDATRKLDPALRWQVAHGSLMPFNTAALAHWHANRRINETNSYRDSLLNSTVRYF